VDIAAWLRGLGLEQYEPAFRANEIDERVLPSLTSEDLKEIGVVPIGHPDLPLSRKTCCVSIALPVTYPSSLRTVLERSAALSV
jgi:hypothetical protein